MINIISSSRYKLNKKSIKQKVEKILSELQISPNEIVNLIFVGKNKMKKLSLTYKNEDVALPVLSFPFKNESIENEKILGEIVLCYPQIVLLSAERNRRVEETIIAMIKHGIENLLR